jgi:FkbM family methyltransferase
MHPVRIARHFGRLALQRAFPTPEQAAWRHLIDYADHAASQRTHHVHVLDLDLEFPDPSALASQWHDTFVRETLSVTFDTDAPRVLDCGAHVGLVSLWIKRRWPEARITAFEPDPDIAAMLRRNLQRNDAADVEVVEAAMWNAAGSVTFRATASDAGAIDEVATGGSGRPCQVAAVRLRDWLQEPVDLLKLDIEGAELDVLDDSGAALSAVSRVHLEVHDFDSRRRLLPRCLLRLEEAGFTYALSDLGSAVWRDGVGVAGPFAHAVPSWVVAVRAWRAEQ